MNQTTGQLPTQPVNASHKPVLFLVLAIIAIVAGVGIYQFRSHKSAADSAPAPEESQQTGTTCWGLGTRKGGSPVLLMNAAYC